METLYEILISVPIHKVSLALDLPLHSDTVFGYFLTSTAEWNGQERDDVHKAFVIHFLPLYQNSLPTQLES